MRAYLACEVLVGHTFEHIVVMLRVEVEPAHSQSVFKNKSLRVLFSALCCQNASVVKQKKTKMAIKHW